jgi:hypothetical protein
MPAKIKISDHHAGVYALPMTADEIEVFELVAGGRDPPRRRVRELWALCGRREPGDVSIEVEHPWLQKIRLLHLE